jgi:hypothetical protein
MQHFECKAAISSLDQGKPFENFNAAKALDVFQALLILSTETFDLGVRDDARTNQNQLVESLPTTSNQASKRILTFNLEGS